VVKTIDSYRRTIEGYFRMWQHHFEFLLLGYGAHMTFFDFCKKAFPEIPDQSVSFMVAGLEALMFRPDEELKKLAKAAIDLDVGDAFVDGASAQAVIAAMTRFRPLHDRVLVMGHDGAAGLPDVGAETRSAAPATLSSSSNKSNRESAFRPRFVQLAGRKSALLCDRSGVVRSHDRRVPPRRVRSTPRSVFDSSSRDMRKLGLGQLVSAHLHANVLVPDLLHCTSSPIQSPRMGCLHLLRRVRRAVGSTPG